MEGFFTYSTENTAAIDPGECFAVLEAFDTLTHDDAPLRLSAIRRLDARARITRSRLINTPSGAACDGSLYTGLAFILTGGVSFDFSYTSAGELHRMRLYLPFSTMLVPPARCEEIASHDAHVLSACIRPVGYDRVFLSATIMICRSGVNTCE